MRKKRNQSWLATTISTTYLKELKNLGRGKKEEKYTDLKNLHNIPSMVQAYVSIILINCSPVIKKKINVLIAINLSKKKIGAQISKHFIVFCVFLLKMWCTKRYQGLSTVKPTWVSIVALYFTCYDPEQITQTFSASVSSSLTWKRKPHVSHVLSTEIKHKIMHEI